MMMYGSFSEAIHNTRFSLIHSSNLVKGTQWQSTDVSKLGPQAYMHEIINLSYSVGLKDCQTLKQWQEDIKPNLPWADDHFQERVGGVPLNPGVQWSNWPYAHSANRYRKEGEQFSHTYMERYWPKHANTNIAPEHMEASQEKGRVPLLTSHTGIRYDYGDLTDVINLLEKDPLTRQAYLPVWFPEDTGVVHGERVPCTLGYHFLYRSGHFYCTYYIRSCDFVRHYRDDLYLTLRLMIYVLDRLRIREDALESNTIWHDCKLGIFTFHCVSMHCFEADYQRLINENTTTQ